MYGASGPSSCPEPRPDVVDPCPELAERLRGAGCAVAWRRHADDLARRVAEDFSLDAVDDEQEVGRLGAGLGATGQIRGSVEQAGRSCGGDESVDARLAQRALLEVRQEPARVDRPLGAVNDEPALVDRQVRSGGAERADRRKRLADPGSKGESSRRGRGRRRRPRAGASAGEEENQDQGRSRRIRDAPSWAEDRTCRVVGRQGPR